jgi:C_GCAxxG_C_C family probable redox protein
MKKSRGMPSVATDLSNENTGEKAAQWREKWLNGIRLGKGYDAGPREKAAAWAIKWGRESLRYTLDGEYVAPGCTEIVLEALQLHGGSPILPVRVDRLEDITIGFGGGFSGQGEVCGAVSGHIIAIGVDVAYRTRETAVIRKEVMKATVRFCKLIKEKFGALRCKDLTGLSFLKADGSFDPDVLNKVTAGNKPPMAKCEDIIRFCIYAPLPSEEG